MDCLDGLIGIRGCEVDTPDSIYFINDLPNLSIKDVDAAINTEAQSAIAEMRKKITLAGDLIAARVQTLLQPRYKGGSVIENGVLGFVKENQQLIEVQTGKIGKHIEIQEGDYLEFFLSRIGIHTSVTGNVDVYVYDLIQNKLLDTLTIAAVAGEVSYLDVYKKYKSNGQKVSLFICYDYQAGYQTTLSKNNCTSCTGQVYNNPYIRVANRAINSSTFIKDNLVSGEDSLVLNYSVNCTFEPFLCNMKHLLALPIWYKAGELLVTEMKYSKRNNSYINIYGAEHSELITAYSTAAETEINNVLQNMRLPSNVCYQCNRRVFLR